MDTLDITSAISSKVPVPPGKAIKASPSSIIFALRSDISLVTISSVKPSYCATASIRNCGSTPIARPPALKALSASTPISPLFEPPYTSVLPLLPIQLPSSPTEDFSERSFPSKAPRYTVIFILINLSAQNSKQKPCCLFHYRSLTLSIRIVNNYRRQKSLHKRCAAYIIFSRW